MPPLFTQLLDPTTLAATVIDDEGRPLEGCTVTAQADNGTTLEARTDSEGRCAIEVKTRRTLRLLISYPEYPAAIIDRIDPAESVTVTLPRTENVGSITMHSTGHIPGLRGRLNPIRDTSNRTYLYADNIAINDGQNQPTAFKINTPMQLEDADGTVVYASVKHIAGRVALLQFSRR